MLSKPLKDDCGCGGGKFNCVTKNTFKKWVVEELKRLDCGCGCKGQKGFDKKYGLVGGAVLADCPPGWRNDGLTCVEPCGPNERDDGLTCRAKCPDGMIDDGLTCRRPITSTMNSCPDGSRDVAGTCWGPTTKWCVDDCFKHPAPGCRSYWCGRLKGAFGEDWGPKLCTDCNLRCGETCWWTEGITKQLHERDLKVSGGEVIGQNIRLKQIRGRVDFGELLKAVDKGMTDLLSGNIDLAAAFDPERNGVNAAFRKFGNDINAVLNEVQNRIVQGFKNMGDAAKKAFEEVARNAERDFKKFGDDFVAKMKDPDFWVEFVGIAAMVAGAALSIALTVGTLGIGAPAAAGIMAACAMAGPAARMIAAGARGQPIDALDIAELVVAGATAAIPGLSGVVSTAMKVGVQAAKVTITCVKVAQSLDLIPSSCISGCPPPIDLSGGPPLDDVDIPDHSDEAAPPGQLSYKEIAELQPVNTIKYKGGKNPDYLTEEAWVAKYRLEKYGSAGTTTDASGALVSAKDAALTNSAAVATPSKKEVNVEGAVDDLQELEDLGDLELAGDDEEDLGDLELAPEDDEELGDLELAPEDDEELGNLELAAEDDEEIGDLALAADEEEELGNLELAAEDEEDLGNLELAVDEKENVEDMKLSGEDEDLGNLELAPEDEEVPAKTSREIGNLDELAGMGRRKRRGGATAEELPVIDVKATSDEYSNPWGTMSSGIPKADIPKTAGGEDFDPKCYAQNYPDINAAVNGDLDRLTTHWINEGSKQGLDADCGGLERAKGRMIAKQKEVARIAALMESCKITDGFWEKETNKCDQMRHADGSPNKEAQECTKNNNIWVPGENGKNYCNRYILENGGYKDGKQQCSGFGGFWDGERCDISRNVDGETKTIGDICTADNSYWDPETKKCDTTRDRLGKPLTEEILCDDSNGYWNEGKCDPERNKDGTRKTDNDICSSTNQCGWQNYTQIPRPPYSLAEKTKELKKTVVDNVDGIIEDARKVYLEELRRWIIESFKQETKFAFKYPAELPADPPPEYVNQVIKDLESLPDWNDYMRTPMPRIKTELPPPPPPPEEVLKAIELGPWSSWENADLIEKNKQRLSAYANSKDYLNGQLSQNYWMFYNRTAGNQRTWPEGYVWDKYFRERGELPKYIIKALRDLRGTLNTGSGKPRKSLTLYYADWCHFCHDLIPIWKKMSSGYKGIKLIMIEEKQNKSFPVQGYPTIIYRDGKRMEKYEGARTKSGIISFLKKKLTKA